MSRYFSQTIGDEYGEQASVWLDTTTGEVGLEIENESGLMFKSLSADDAYYAGRILIAMSRKAGPIERAALKEHQDRMPAACGFCWTYNTHSQECIDERFRT